MSSFTSLTGAQILQRPKTQLRVTDNLDELLAVLPPQVRRALEQEPSLEDLLEVILDLGREPQARFPDRTLQLSNMEVTEADIDYVVQRVGAFGKDNRAGIERTLHRISAIRNRQGRIIGLTCRVGRAVFGTIDIIRDIVESGRSILLLGKPGVGKTTMLRETARVLAERKRVVIVDTSNEIAGDGDIPHPAIGRARRMQVVTPALQHAVMIEAVENHMPEVIIIDEIGTDLEAAAARTIAERGVQLVATAHGNTLENLTMNPTLCDLIGGIQSVTLGDEEARRRGTQKSILERKAPPTFDVVVEIQSWERVSVHPNVAETVDSILRGYDVPAEVREIDKEGSVRVVGAPSAVGQTKRSAQRQGPVAARRERKIYPFGVSRRRLEQAIHQMGMPATIVEHLVDADALITLRSYYRRKPQVLRDAEEHSIPIYVIKSNTVFQMEQCLLSMRSERGRDPVLSALQEAEKAIGQVMKAERPIELSPQNAYIRRLQHMLAQRYNLTSRSLGQEPHRRVRILPGGPA